MKKRTLGWVQNPGSLSTLKSVVASITPGTEPYENLRANKLPLLLKNDFISQEDYDSFQGILSGDNPLKINWNILVGTSSTPRQSAKCTGIIQAIIDAQKDIEILDQGNAPQTIKKPYTDDWTSSGYLRWAISLCLLEWDRKTDKVYVTELGKELAFTEDGSSDEAECLTRAILSYPPAVRVLRLLNAQNNLTKFELGKEIGFNEEDGFTSVPQGEHLALMHLARSKEELQKVRQNNEGDADKYARMICSWLAQLNMVKKSEKEVTETYDGETYSNNLISYSITLTGRLALKKSDGYSSNPKTPKYVPFEMLATKATDADFLRKRRAMILHQIERKKTYACIQEYLTENGIQASIDTVKDDISGLIRIGINIETVDDSAFLKDIIIGLEIPEKRIESHDVTEIKERVRPNLKNLSHDHLKLVELAFEKHSTKGDTNKRARNFEIGTYDLFKELGFDGKHLGGSDKPDNIIWHGNTCVIIDDKSYIDGFSASRHDTDEMGRYIDDFTQKNENSPWWKIISGNVTIVKYLFVTSFTKGNYQKNLKNLNNNKHIDGAVIGVESLLLLSEVMKEGGLTKDEFFNLFNNDEIKYLV